VLILVLARILASLEQTASGNGSGFMKTGVNNRINTLGIGNSVKSHTLSITSFVSGTET
jgi:hypothetical protein